MENLGSLFNKAPSMLFKELLFNNAPSIAKGMICELLSREVVFDGKTRHIDTRLISELVTRNISLWSLFSIDIQLKIKDGITQLDAEWFNTAWLIDAIKQDFPALASQFLGWRKAHNWLERQLKEVKPNS